MVNPTIFSNIPDTFAQANVVTGYIFWPLAVLAIWIVLFLKFKSFDFVRALVGASSVTMIIALLLFVLGLVPLSALLIPVFLAVIGGAFL